MYEVLFFHGESSINMNRMNRRVFLAVSSLATVAVLGREKGMAQQPQLQGDGADQLLELIGLETTRLVASMRQHGEWDDLNRERGLFIAHNLQLAALRIGESGYDELLDIAIEGVGDEAFLEFHVEDGLDQLRREAEIHALSLPPSPYSIDDAREVLAGLRENGLPGHLSVGSQYIRQMSDGQEAEDRFCSNLDGQSRRAEIAAGIVCGAALIDPTPILKTACLIAMGHAAVLKLTYEINC